MYELLENLNIPEDKANHFIWSFVLCAMCFMLVLFFNNITNMSLSVNVLLTQAVIFTATIGFIKEMLDDMTIDNYLSWSDMLANTLGALAFSLTLKLGSVLF